MIGKKAAQLAVAIGMILMSQGQSSASDARAVAAATPELIRRNLDPKSYASEVEHEGDRVIVIFSDPEATSGTRGSSGKLPSIEVELDKRDFLVIRSYFVR